MKSGKIGQIITSLKAVMKKTGEFLLDVLCIF